MCHVKPGLKGPVVCSGGENEGNNGLSGRYVIMNFNLAVRGGVSMRQMNPRRALNRALGVLLVASLPFLLWQCSDKSVDPEPDVSRELTKVEAELAKSGNEFGLRLFQSLSNSAPDSNVFISPLSVAMALGMAYNGADGTTKEAMENTLGLTGLSLEEINQSYQSLIELLTKLDHKVKFEIANSIWYREDFAVEQEFLDVNQIYFDAEVAALNFSSPDATQVINEWVNDKTNGKIEKIVSAIPDYMVMYLVNAIYFKGTWTYRFDPARTQDGQFYREDGSTAPCRLMNQTAGFDYFSNQACVGVDMPYGKEKFSMTVLMPRGNTDINTLIMGLTPKTWDEWMAGFSGREIGVWLPKFKLGYAETLNDALTALGMGIAFTPAADFTKINQSGGLLIDEVKHKTYVEVNEEGTEAAAVTSIGIGIVSEPPNITFDHPYLYVIRERQSGTILFIGKMMDVSSGS